MHRCEDMTAPRIYFCARGAGFLLLPTLSIFEAPRATSLLQVPLFLPPPSGGPSGSHILLIDTRVCLLQIPSYACRATGAGWLIRSWAFSGKEEESDGDIQIENSADLLPSLLVSILSLASPSIGLCCCLLAPLSACCLPAGRTACPLLLLRPLL